jgi:hypothetical protein
MKLNLYYYKGYQYIVYNDNIIKNINNYGSINDCFKIILEGDIISMTKNYLIFEYLDLNNIKTRNRFYIDGERLKELPVEVLVGVTLE